MAEEKRSPVWYVAKELSNINNELVQPGQRVLYDGLPSDNLEPTDDEGRARAKEFKDSDRKRQQQQANDYQDSAVGDPEKFAAALAKELAKQKEESDAKFAEMQAQSQQQNDRIEQLLKALTNAVPAVVHTDEPAAVAEPAAPAPEVDDKQDDKSGDTKTTAKRSRGE